MAQNSLQDVAVLKQQMVDLKDQVEKTENRLSSQIDNIGGKLDDFIECADNKYARKDDVDGVKRIIFWFITAFAGILISIIIKALEGHLSF